MTTYINGKVNSEFVNPAILDWLTFTAQNSGYLTIALPAAIKINEADGETATTSAYVLSRRAYRSDIANTTASVTGTTTSATEVTVINGQKFFLNETLFSRLYFNGMCTGQCYIGLVSSNASGTAYLNDVVVSLKVLKSDATTRTLGTQTIQVDVSNATTVESFKSVPWNFSIAGSYLDTSEKLYLEISTTGYNSSSSYTTTQKLYFTAGSSETYVEVQV